MAALTYQAYGLAESPSLDFDQIWTGVHPFVHGQDPYKAVADLGLHAPLFYPLTALITVAPLGFLSAGVARIVFAASGLWGPCVRGRGRRGGLFMGMLSASAINAAVGGQWSPLFTAGAAVPWLSVFWWPSRISGCHWRLRTRIARRCGARSPSRCSASC